MGMDLKKIPLARPRQRIGAALKRLYHVGIGPASQKKNGGKRGTEHELIITYQNQWVTVLSLLEPPESGVIRSTSTRRLADSPTRQLKVTRLVPSWKVAPPGT